MKKLLLLLALCLFPSIASAQCNGTFGNNSVCGNFTGATAPPRQSNITSIVIISPTLSGATLTSPTINNGTVNSILINSATISAATITSATITVPNNIGILGENAAGNGTVEIARVNASNFVQVGGPLGGGTAVVMPQQLSLYGAAANGDPLDIGGGGASVTLRVTGNNSGAGCGEGFQFVQNGGVIVAIGNIPWILGAACTQAPGIYTNDFVTNGTLQFYFQSIGTSAAYIDINGYEGKIGQGVAYPGKFTTLTASNTVNLPDGSVWNTTNLTIPTTGTATSPSVVFSVCGVSCGFYATGTQSLALAVNGQKVWAYEQLEVGAPAFEFFKRLDTNGNGITSLGDLIASVGGSYRLTDIVASSTQPTFIPNNSDLTAGIGADQAGDVSIIINKSAASFEAVRITSQTFTLATSIQFQNSTTGASTQTFTNSPCSALTTERWIPVKITGLTSSFFIPACS